jgi:hypothetical protein
VSDVRPTLRFFDPQVFRLRCSWNGANNTVVNSLTQPKSGWWYHKGLFVDVNCDGAPDIVTARGSAGWLGGSGELVWIDGTDNTMHHLADGPDINFDINYNLNGTSAPFVVYASEFFGKQLTAFEVACGGVVTQRAVLDNQIGEVFSVEFADLNNTGVKNQLVVTNYAYTPPGSLFVYDLVRGNPLKIARRRTISSDFSNRQWLPGAGSPGQVQVIWPNVPRRAGDRAVLAVAGDGSEDLHFFVPDSTSASGYSLAQRLSFGATVGGICAADVDGDGHSEVFVALYETSTVLVFKVY